jgi:hypothetical protein
LHYISLLVIDRVGLLEDESEIEFVEENVYENDEERVSTWKRIRPLEPQTSLEKMCDPERLNLFSDAAEDINKALFDFNHNGPTDDYFPSIDAKNKQFPQELATIKKEYDQAIRELRQFERNPAEQGPNRDSKLKELNTKVEGIKTMFQEARQKKIQDWRNTERGTDTVAVAFTKDGTQILIAGNVKKREKCYPSRNNNNAALPPESLGLQHAHIPIIKKVLEQPKYAPILETNMIRTVKPKNAPQTVFENAKTHAKMVIIKYLQKKNPIICTQIGVSKSPCRSCKQVLLDKHGIFSWSGFKDKVKKIMNSVDFKSPKTGENQNPTNWEHPDHFDVKKHQTIKKDFFKVHKNF